MKLLRRSLFLVAVLIAMPAAAQRAPAQYGEPIAVREALQIIERGMQQSVQQDLAAAFAVVEPSGELVAFARMDGAPYASIQIAQQKARTAARLRLSTAELEARVLGGRTVLLSSDEVLAIGGGVPIIRDGRVVGALGVSGGASAQDAAIAAAVVTGQ